ncbi:hypothetical protein SAMN04488038_110110 [Solimonas aquatica]|uniref:Uncharacterized protein n=1 Tax=Solimonas aquatica TaxID=489703 RepID=A0A1H9INH8_9GAMM|nr:hypothetical protein [Solimonas aquatica]SEQ76042.1 hypothetical protein SAMN04488038_110110 [Solimonas aquatica]
MNMSAQNLSISLPVSGCSFAENELKADLFWRYGPQLPAQLQTLMFGYISRKLRGCAANCDCAAYSTDAARELCRSHIRHLMGQFTAWTPLDGD